MKAKVKADFRYSVVNALAGREFTKREWRPVPPGHEEEARNHPYLDVDKTAVDEDEPILAADIEGMEEEALRQFAKEQGVGNWWNKSLDNLVAELRED